jgi:alanine-glyoxylate transaminase/serine-glyoxylate transaminase/serine-pyruvate transaminase
MADIVGRLGGELVRVEAEWGKIIDPQDVKKALDGGKTKLVGIVHAETSTGVLQPLDDIGRMVKDHGALFLVDTVTSLGGHPVEVDAWEIDAVYSGTQKCLSCPPGLAPISFSQRAVDVVQSRKTKVASWYLDLTLLTKYWGGERVYHHTAPISMNYALREALRIVVEEGLDARWERHRRNHLALVEGLKALGFEMFVPKAERLWTLNAVKLPDGLDDLEARKQLLQQYGIEVGSGLGALKGKLWRIGLMGETSRMNNVFLLLSALGSMMKERALITDAGAGVKAAGG